MSRRIVGDDLLPSRGEVTLVVALFAAALVAAAASVASAVAGRFP